MVAYLETLKNVWEVCLGFCALSLCITFFEKEIVMRTTLDSGHQLKEGEGNDDPEATELKITN